MSVTWVEGQPPDFIPEGDVLVMWTADEDGTFSAPAIFPGWMRVGMNYEAFKARCIKHQILRDPRQADTFRHHLASHAARAVDTADRLRHGLSGRSLNKTSFGRLVKACGALGQSLERTRPNLIMCSDVAAHAILLAVQLHIEFKEGR